MAKSYDIVVFSKDDEEFTQNVVKKISPDNSVKHVLSGQHCNKLNNIMAKNLNILGRRLKDIVLLEVYNC